MRLKSCAMLVPATFLPASIYGEYFSGAAGSAICLDDFELIY